MNKLFGKTQGDKVIWAIVVILSLVSVLAVYSSTGTLAYRMQKGHTEYYLFKQFAELALGILIIYFSHRVNYTVYSRIAVVLFLISIPLLIYTLFFGSNINEANRWIKLPVINLTFQTSDMAKLALFMYISRQLSRKQNVIKDFKKGFLPIIVPVCIICGLIMPANMSTALLLGASCMLLCFIGRVNIKYLLAMAGIGILGIALVVTIVLATGVGGGRAETWKNRIAHFKQTEKTDAPYQVQQAKIAVANGGTFGRGPGNSEQRNFLPHPYSDFIYAIIIEEYGLAGGFLMIAFYMIFLFRSIRIFRRCPYAFGAFLAVGLSFTLVIQAFANMAVNVNLFPVTGVTLPLVSMGGTSIWFTSLAIGIILSVSRNVEETEGRQITADKTTVNTSDAFSPAPAEAVA
ncbi:FtsW/RodA/SpoVE family cell cycle protein [Compostibacter hankyongensis]|uniref:Probable peptidoglycan glycosyltransferase FtsW n=1 Tax=Compostibacter hankyongensis TaxID=1007089 RepID=A0ABP8FHD3_9BACT